MIKICHITSAHPPFDGRIFHKQCVSLVKAGYHVSLVTTHDKKEIVDGVHIVPLPKSKGRAYRFFVKTFQAFFKGLKTKSSIYHLHDPELMPFGICLKLCGKKVIFDMHELVYHQIGDKDYIGNKFFRKFFAGAYRVVERIAMRLFDRIVLAEDGYWDYFKKNYPKRVNKLVFVRNYPIIGLIDRMLAKEESKSNQKFTLVYAGSLTKIRGIKEICDAVRMSKYDVRLILLGIWSEPAFMEQCGIDGNKITYLGVFPLEKVYGVLNQADLGVSLLHPLENHMTCLPVKTFEYMACGIPMIMSDFPVWKSAFEGVALFADPLSVKNIAEVIDSAYENRDLLKQMGTAGYERVRREFSWENESKALVDMYQSLSVQNIA